MSWSYDPTTLVGLVRLLALDTASDNVLYQDEEVTAFLSLNNNNVRLAAAQVLDNIAANEALVQKVMKSQDFMTDGSKTADSLKGMAAELRRQEYEGAGDFAGMFDIAEQVHDEFTVRERVIKQHLRTNS